MKYKLEDIDKKLPLKVPEGYFEELPMKIQARVQEKPAPAFSLIPGGGM